MKSVVIGTFASLALPALASAATFTFPDSAETKIVPTDGAGFDEFGGAVAISGATAIVGSSGDDDKGRSSGSAYLFDTSSGAQIAKLTASDGAASDQFGWSVAISGTTALVGSRWDDDNGHRSGSAYLFDTSSGSQIAKLTASDGAARDRFGYSVAISGATAIVGSPFDFDNGSFTGSAYLFDTSTGAQIAKLTPSDSAGYGRFGWSVAISGTTALVGSLEDDDNGIRSGSAYLFDTITGAQIAKLTASDGAAEDNFGNSVAISGATAIVGSRRDDDDGSNSGSAYLFDTITGAQIAKLTASDGAAGDRFGGSVAISGTTALVGSGGDGNADNDGSAYLFDFSDKSNVTEIAKLTASDGAAFDSFGNSVAISGTTALVGSYRDEDNGSRSGSAYLFDTTATKIRYIPPPIPLPAGIWLLATALGVLVLGRRRGI